MGTLNANLNQEVLKDSGCKVAASKTSTCRHALLGEAVQRKPVRRDLSAGGKSCGQSASFRLADVSVSTSRISVLVKAGLAQCLLLLCLTVLSSCGETADGPTSGTTAPPNVLFLAVDDLNNLLGSLNGAYGAKTPNLDRLAARGVLFSNAHCQAPLCGPSRASIMTGLRPSTTGIYGMIPDNEIRSDNPATKDIVLLPEYFRNNGYHTMGIGKLFHKHAPDGVFDESGGRVNGFGPVPPKRFVWDGYGSSDRTRYGRTSTDWGAYPEVDSLMPDHQSVDWAMKRLYREYDKPFFWV
ncbi:sulfatase-like hydrolase/transferase [Neolewinella persica]|uniref:sulfatase-like hydrolase/transferase n=1 Tax=Neolewinella persica TaxID=70998 RepID=UPI0003A89427|nr:sulfatase-like hydrolase/transferase [Neolewinella persica]